MKAKHFRYDNTGNRTAWQRQSAGGESISVTQAVGVANRLGSIAGGGPTRFFGQLNEPAKVTVNGVQAQVNAQNQFEAYVPLATGTHTVAITASAPSLSGTTKSTTRSYRVAIAPGAAEQGITYDANGNPLSDGQRTYEWNTLNQLMAINHTGSSAEGSGSLGGGSGTGTPTAGAARRTEFAYNSAGQRVRITERVASSVGGTAVGGTVTSDRRYTWQPGATQPDDERDAASNTVLRRFYPQGEQILSGTDAQGRSTVGLYYYTRDHLGSIRELTDATGTLRTRYDYDVWGARTANLVTAQSPALSGTTTSAPPSSPTATASTLPLDTDLGFTGYRLHTPRRLYLSATRLFSPTRGGFI